MTIGFNPTAGSGRRPSGPNLAQAGAGFPGPGPGCGLGSGCAPRASWALGHFRSGSSEALNRPEQGIFFQKQFFK